MSEPGLWSTGVPHRLSFGELVGRISDVPRQPLFTYDPLFDPGGAFLSRHLDMSMLSPQTSKTRTPATFLFEAQSRALGPRCLRFAHGFPHSRARLAFGWWLAFTERDWLPAGLLSQVSIFHIHPPKLGIDSSRTESRNAGTQSGVIPGQVRVQCGPLSFSWFPYFLISLARSWLLRHQQSLTAA